MIPLFAGPRGLPLLGYAPFLPRLDPKRPHNALQILSKTYGPVTGFYLGPCQPFVGVVGIDAVKEALHNDDLNGRPGTQVILSRSWGERLGSILIYN
jgi:methyl farnesoate epoxidase/farnesoate epoxidase